MSALSIINSVWKTLTADSEFLGYFGLSDSSTPLEKNNKIQREIEPNGLSSDNIPLCCIYPVAGLRSKTNLAFYNAMFEVAIFSDNSSGPKTETSKAGTMTIGARALILLHLVQLAGATARVEFQSEFQTSSGINGIKKYVMRFKVSDEIG